MNSVHINGSDTIQVGLIGCGGRGTGAAHDCAASSDGVKIVAMADLFPDRLNGSRENLKGLGDKYGVTDDMCFTGFDAYQKLLATDVDMVILATPPGFRPVHFAAAVAAGKNIFMEKPVAVCPTGIKMVMDAGKIAKDKGLAVVSGTQRRHQKSYLETMKRIHDGAIGKIIYADVYWNGGELWSVPRKPDMTDMEWQLRNWLYFTWLSGDHICEQHIHNIDIANWAMQAHPVKAFGMGGRQVRTDPAYGAIFDHFAIQFEYPDGQVVHSFCRQTDNTHSNVSEFVVGTEGKSDPGGWIRGKTDYDWKGDQAPYVQEHTDLIASIRAGQPLNEAQRVAESTMSAILGRMVAYTGQEITWDQAMDSKLNLVRENVAFGPAMPEIVAMPGRTPVA